MEIFIIVLLSFVSLVSAGEMECGSEVLKIHCPDASYIPRALGSRGKFFQDVIGLTCFNMGEEAYEDIVEGEVFVSKDGGLTLSAGCPDETQIITKIDMCITDGHVTAMRLQCSSMKDPTTMTDRTEVTSKGMGHMLVDCGEKSAMQKIEIEDCGDKTVSSVAMKCVKIGK